MLPYVVVAAARWHTTRRTAAPTVDALGYPVFVKPAPRRLQHRHQQGRARATSSTRRSRRRRAGTPRCVVEASAGEGAREIECGVLDGFEHDPPRASPVAEITVQGDHDFYDFEAKYLAEAARHRPPADLDDEVADEIRRLSVSAFEALECEGLARVDFFLLADGSLVINEINTMPGLHPDLDVPADVDGDRDDLRRAGRPPRPAGAATGPTGLR